MIIWGFGKTTRKVIGQVFQNMCSYCNSTEVWQLCIMRTWFTLFFIPIIPYKTQYCISCPKCGSYMELTKEQFEKIQQEMANASSTVASDFISEPVDDSVKYAGKTETQINYLKQMEEFNSRP